MTMAKYDPLQRHLASCYPREMSMSFEEINALLETPLPETALLPQFWANSNRRDGGQVQREAWRTAGYNAFLVSEEARVRFVPVCA